MKKKKFIILIIIICAGLIIWYFNTFTIKTNYEIISKDIINIKNQNKQLNLLLRVINI